MIKIQVNIILYLFIINILKFYYFYTFVYKKCKKCNIFINIYFLGEIEVNNIINYHQFKLINIENFSFFLTKKPIHLYQYTSLLYKRILELTVESFSVRL